MCGIAGLFLSDTSSNKISVVRKMTDAIKHRGLDGEGHWVNSKNNIAFGHRRLSIIDLSENAKQPMHYCEGRYTITFNGGIYNYLELKESLLKIGYQFTSNSDTEVLIALYDCKGANCLQDLDGMFAFAIWDEKEQVLFCARDRFGEKPFFYYHEPGKAFYFASEMKALWAIGAPKEIDDNRIRQYLDWKFLDTSDLSGTFYRKINQLDSAHFLLISNLNIIEQKRYYSLSGIQKKTGITCTEAAIALYGMLESSVKLRLRSDVPVGSSLSGGLDSSSLVMLINKVKGNSIKQNSFSARFSGFNKDEGYFINKVIDACGNIKSHEVWPDQDQLIEEIDKVIYHQEEPFASASIFAQWKVMELAKKNDITVLIDGQGADEYLAGYLPYYELYVNQLFYNKKKLYRKEIASYNSLRSPEKLKQYQSVRQRIGYLRRKILNQDLPFSQNILKSVLERDTMVEGLKVLLRYADRNSMAHSREVRLPFLDHKIVEFIFSLPDDFSLKDGWTKWILRMAMKDLLPNEIVWRVDKIGFEPPQSEWLKKVLTPQMELKVNEYLLDKKIYKSKKSGITDWNYFMLNKIIN